MKGLTPLQMEAKLNEVKKPVNNIQVAKLSKEVVNVLSDIMLMMDHWQADYRKSCSPRDDNEWVYRDFANEICEFVQPYMMRLYKTSAIPYNVGQAICAYAFDKVEELRGEMEQQYIYSAGI